MKVENIEIKGIKAAVSDVRHECADRWIILLDMSDWSVRERGLIGCDEWCEDWPEVTIASGYANSGWGHNLITMYELRNIVAEVIKVCDKARAEYANGTRHNGGAEWGETLTDYVRTEVHRVIEWANEERRYACA